MQLKEKNFHLKAWSTSIEHFSTPHPKKDDRKIIMERNGMNSKQVTDYFCKHRRNFPEKKQEEESKIFDNCNYRSENEHKIEEFVFNIIGDESRA